MRLLETIGGVLFLIACAACSDPVEPAPPREQPPGCESSGCPAGQRCEGGSCIVEGSGGSGAGACGASDDCRGPFDDVPDIYWDGDPGRDATCTIPGLSCPGSVACEVPTECSAAPDGATRPGSVRCETDEQCWSGRCLDLGPDRPRSCLRACTTDGDCARVTVAGGSEAGFRCEEVSISNVLVSTCLPLDPERQERTLCRRDCDCGTSDACDAPPADGTSCRFVGQGSGNLDLPLCLLPDPERPADEPAQSRCYSGAGCVGGACARPCEALVTDPVNLCRTTPSRCSGPCATDRDCPQRSVCRTGSDTARAGSWLIPGQEPEAPGRALLLCMLPPLGCYEESDCCPVDDGSGGCLHGWSADRRRCSVVLSPPADAPRLLTLCQELDGRLTPGSCCAAHADCDSNLCVPARDGTACAGGGVCSVPCEPDPEANPAAPDGDHPDVNLPRELCPLLATPGNDYHLLSTCLPYEYELPVGSAVELRVCR